MKTLHISAGGKGERIAPYIATIQPFLPKHLLPIPTEGKTILGEIIFKAHESFEEICVWTSKETYPRIVLGLEKSISVKTVIDAKMTGPLGPMVRNLLETKSRTFACAGDFYCDFSWNEFEQFHDTHGFPVSILVAKSIPAPGGARFLLQEDIVTGWERVTRTHKKDNINIGCYIVDPVPEIISKLEKLQAHKEDAFFDSLVPEKLVGGYNPNTLSFNVNVAEVYESLLHRLGHAG